jgi:uncharacterized protein YkwD
MDEWIQLTEEDVARANSLRRVLPPPAEPADQTITITMDDLPAEAGPLQVSAAIITITRDDVRPVAGPVEATPSIERLERLMFQLLNETRQSHIARLVGTAVLVWHDQLAEIARRHSTDMLKRQYVDHVTPEGLSTAQRVQKARIGYVACGENIGVVYGESAQSEQAIYDIHEAFMNQPRSMTNHRANLLNPLWTHVGVGIAHNPEGALVATQLFISAPGEKLRGR